MPAADCWLLRSCNGECENALRRDSDFLLACSGSNSSPGSRTRSSANGSSFAASGHRANQRAGASAAADLGYVALGMALALAADARAIDSFAIDRGKAQAKRAWFMQASAAVYVSYFTFDRRARLRHDLAMFNYVMR